MKTDPTSNISIAVGTSLPQHTIQNHRSKLINQAPISPPSEAISDTLETSDRDGDGRLTLHQPPQERGSKPEGEIDVLG